MSSYIEIPREVAEDDDDEFIEMERRMESAIAKLTSYDLRLPLNIFGDQDSSKTNSFRARDNNLIANGPFSNQWQFSGKD